MRIADVSINRPVFATMINLVLIVFGLFSLPRLAVDQYPKVDFPVVTVSVIADITSRVSFSRASHAAESSGLAKNRTTRYASTALRAYSKYGVQP